MSGIAYRLTCALRYRHSLACVMPPPDADPVSLLRPRIQQILDHFLHQQHETLESLSPELLPLIDSVTELLRGGKRLRPAFCYWGWRAAAGNGADDAVLTVAAALELFQAAALVHDDLIDDSDTRRGIPAVHRRFAARHRDAGWRGDPATFGTAAAVLVGDLLLGWSDELFFQAGLRDDVSRRARPIFERMRTEVGAGQYLDVLAQADTTASSAAQVQRARQVIIHKSARYSVQHPLALGANMAGAPTRTLDALEAYGAALGEAFQLRDDVLGVFGDPSQTGKPAGDDLREGKRTLLVAHALEHADGTQANAVTTLLGDPQLDQAGIDQLREVLVATGALARVESRISDLVDYARATLDGADVTHDGRSALAMLITLTTTRTH